MRESIGGAWLIGLVITFMLIFVAYLTVMINYSTAFKTKNEVVNIIEKYEGISKNTSLPIINNYLANSGYNAQGKCSCVDDNDNSHCYGVSSLETTSTTISKASKNNKYYYCVEFTVSDNNTGYYNIELFLKFDLPVLGQIGNFKVKGETIKIKYPANKDDSNWAGISNN